jgi:hypothetical protein
MAPGSCAHSGRGSLGTDGPGLSPFVPLGQARRDGNPGGFAGVLVKPSSAVGHPHCFGPLARDHRSGLGLIVPVQALGQGEAGVFDVQDASVAVGGGAGGCVEEQGAQ